MSLILRQLSKALGSYRTAGSSEYTFCSPFVSDRKYHMYVNPKTGKFIDYKSGKAGSLTYLCTLLGIQPEDFDGPPTAISVEDLRHRMEALGKPLKVPIAELPEWYSPVVPGSRVHEYLLGRGVGDEDIDYYRIGQGRGDFTGWLIIPSFNADGQCEYWVSRRCRTPKYGAKYRNPPTGRTFHVGFLHNALQHGRTVILTEGVFSAIIAGRDAVASFGKYVTAVQLAKMRELGVTGIMVALDGDARKEGIDTAQRCYRMGFATWLLLLPVDKDPADMGREPFRAYMTANAVAMDSELTFLRLKGGLS